MAKFCIDGVAATTKTTTLKLLAQKHPDWDVRFNDFFEAVQSFTTKDLFVNKTRTTLLYLMGRCTEEYPAPITVCDRHPASSLIYNIIFDMENYDEEKTIILFRYLLAQFPGWKGIVLLPLKGQESLVVQMMKKRNNGIDCLTEQYVLDQARIFLLWARISKFQVVYIDYTKSLNLQQDEIIFRVEQELTSLNR